MTRNIFSHGFRLFEERKLEENQVKAFCAENILYNIITLIKEGELDEKEIRKMNEFMQNDLAKYNIMQYPKSEDKEFNLIFANKITEVDNLNSNNHDLVNRSGVKF